ncbi:N-formylglutamate amidohydrolase [Sedimentimonas flavescens]|uniref:N-formylglutamate amidohydrolase n=1 Tax=Sedimentimonas flavescens TaxID=2851012 RepID=UPI001C4A557D|nr:N-formylglutamate amidohydrolase [Sedimentimonas flavescens]MBW0158329.1 N-formylglutamate amidohydrolase [Sedimentimonas flavescens]
MTDQIAEIAVSVEGPDTPGRFVVVCEHASNAFPAPWGDLGLSAAQREAHIAWDPGALGLARGLAARLNAALVHANSSRLIYDLNRPPHSAGAMPARSEIHDIPGNRNITPQERLTRTEALYLPFHATLRAQIARKLALGHAPVMVTVHSFTPVFNGKARAVELGVIHDADPALAVAFHAEARAATQMDARLNEPYSAADEVTHTLALQATPLGIPNVMIELRNDLIATPAQQDTMAERLAPLLLAAVAKIEEAR